MSQKTVLNNGKFDSFTQVFIFIDLAMAGLGLLMSPLSFFMTKEEQVPSLTVHYMNLSFSVITLTIALIAGIMLLKKSLLGVKLALTSLGMIVFSMIAGIVVFLFQYDDTKVILEKTLPQGQQQIISIDTLMMITIATMVFGTILRLVYNFFYYKAVRRAEKVIKGEVEEEIYLD